MKKSTTRLLIGVLIVALLAYFFLYTRKERFEDDEEEGFADITVLCRKACKSKGSGKGGLKPCISKCEFLSYQLKGDRRYWKEWKCGTMKAGPKCLNIKHKLTDFNKRFYKFQM
jgi:hypothetical protein